MTASTIPTGIANATLAEEGVDLIIRNLSNMYADPLTAVLREWIANAVDSVTTAHARGEIDSTEGTITIAVPDESSPTLSVTDYGLGMDRAHVFDYALNYGRSSKRGDDTTAGKFGLGLKSGLALANQFIITSVRDGLMTSGFLSLGAEDGGVENFCSPATPTDKPNHTTVQVTVDGYLDMRIYVALRRVLAGYDPKMFRVVCAAGDTFYEQRVLRDNAIAAPDAAQLNKEVYLRKYSVENENNWRVVAVVGGVSYPIHDNIVTHTDELNAAIEQAAGDNPWRPLPKSSKALPQIALICPPESVDIPDNRDTLIFSKRTIATLAGIFARTMNSASAQAQTHFDTHTLSFVRWQQHTWIRGHDHRNPQSHTLMYTFAPEFYNNAEVNARARRHIIKRYGTDIGTAEAFADSLYANTTAIERVIHDHMYNYAWLHSNNHNDGMEVSSLSAQTLRHLDGTVDYNPPLFIRFNVEEYAEERTSRNGDTYVVYVDPKGGVHEKKADCIAAIFNQYRVKINTWRKQNDLPNAVIGPTCDFHTWEEDDFSCVIEFDDFIAQVEEAHKDVVRRRREARQARDKAQPTKIAHYAMFYEDGQYIYHNNAENNVVTNVTIEQLHQFVTNHNIAPADLVIITTNNGNNTTVFNIGKNLLRNNPEVTDAFVVLRTTKTYLKAIHKAGFSSTFTQDEYAVWAVEQIENQRHAFVESLDNDTRRALGAYLWARKHSEALFDKYSVNRYDNYRRRYKKPSNRETLDFVAAQYAGRGIDVTTRGGYMLLDHLIDMVDAGRQAFDDATLNGNNEWITQGGVAGLYDMAACPLDHTHPLHFAAMSILENTTTESSSFIGAYTRSEYIAARTDLDKRYNVYRNTPDKTGDFDFTEAENIIFRHDNTVCYDAFYRIAALD